MTVDRDGNLYIAEYYQVRKIDPSGAISTVAGTGKRGVGGDGDGEPAINARLGRNLGLALDGAGNLYIADGLRNLVRKVDVAGTITTIAGTGRRETVGHGNGGPSHLAAVGSPDYLDVDAVGNLYISAGSVLRRVDVAGTITTIAGSGLNSHGYNAWDGRPAAEARLHTLRDVVTDRAGRIFFSVDGKLRVLEPTLEFANFSNGVSITSDLVLVNVAPVSVRPSVLFFDENGNRIDAGSLVEITENTVVRESGSLTVRDAIAPLEQLAISTNGQGDTVIGSVIVYGAGLRAVSRLNAEAEGTAVAGTDALAEKAIFPIRRVKQGINTKIAVRNVRSVELELSCALMQGGDVIEDVDIQLAAYEQKSQFVTEIFSFIEAADFEGYGSVLCTAPWKRTFTGRAWEMDARNRIFTTLPMVPLQQTYKDGGRHTTNASVVVRNRLDFAHFANGASTASELVLMNVNGHQAIRPVVFFYDKSGVPIAADSVVETTGDLAVRSDGGLIPLYEIEPYGDLTISTTGKGESKSGSLSVIADGPINGFLRLHVPGVGVAGMEARLPVNDAIFLARHMQEGIKTAIALRNMGSEAMEITCGLTRGGNVLAERKVHLEANGQNALFLDQLFVDTDMSAFAGSVRCTAPEGGVFTGVAMEMDIGDRIFTTLPMISIPQNYAQ